MDQIGKELGITAVIRSLKRHVKSLCWCNRCNPHHYGDYFVRILVVDGLYDIEGEEFPFAGEAAVVVGFVLCRLGLFGGLCVFDVSGARYGSVQSSHAAG